MASQAVVTNNSVFVGGPLLFRCHITHEDGSDLTASEVASVTLNVYRVVLNSAGQQERAGVENYSDVALTVSDVIFTTITDDSGKKKNFEHCLESAFELSETTYLVEYRIVTTSGHNIILLIKATTEI